MSFDAAVLALSQQIEANTTAIARLSSLIEDGNALRRNALEVIESAAAAPDAAKPAAKPRAKKAAESPAEHDSKVAETPATAVAPVAAPATAAPAATAAPVGALVIKYDGEAGLEAFRQHVNGFITKYPDASADRERVKSLVKAFITLRGVARAGDLLPTHRDELATLLEKEADGEKLKDLFAAGLNELGIDGPALKTDAAASERMVGWVTKAIILGETVNFAAEDSADDMI
jgi:hypothetical protein